MSSSEWQKVDIPCRHCGSNNVEMRTVEDSECHEDINYHCLDCNYSWWIDGSDY